MLNTETNNSIPRDATNNDTINASASPKNAEHTSSNPNQTAEQNTIIHSSSLSSPSSLIINEKSPVSLSSASSPQSSSSHSSASSHSGRSTSSRSNSPDSSSKKSTNSDDSHHEKEISSSESVVSTASPDVVDNTCLTSSEDTHSEKSEKLQIHEDEHEQDIDDDEPAHLEVDEDIKEANVEDDIKSESIDVEIDVDGASEKGTPAPSPKASQKENNNEVDSKQQQQVETPTPKPVDPVQQVARPVEPVYDKYEAMQPRLKKFLKIYQQSSKNSLDGPSVVSNNHEMIESLNSKQSECGSVGPQSADSPSERSSDTVRSSPETIDDKEESKAKHTDCSSSFFNPMLHQHLSEQNNLSIIASVAAAAYFNQSLNKPPTAGDMILNKLQSNKEKSPPGQQQQLQTNPSMSNYQHHQHPHKRAKYASAFSKPSELSSSKSNGLTTSNSNHSISNITKSSAEKDSAHSKARFINSANYFKCIQADSNTSPLIETLLHNERISCFIVGGEKRLCLHDILNTVLKDFSVQQINNACQKLQIACLESSVKQLEILKKNQLLPTGAPNCGLLTQTNAERLCAYLMDSTLSQSTPAQLSPTYQHQKPQKLKVVHECFGKTYGHLYMSLYARSDSACVECDTCHKFYTPKNFVCHSHKYESNIRHWGFDSENWRIYLKLANSSANIASSQSAEQHNSNILSDKSNKDNIAANMAANNKSSIQQEEFEQFKKKFLHNPKDEAKDLEGIMKRKIEEDIKQSRQFSQQQHQSKHSLLNNSYSGVENSAAKRLMTSSSSLNDLNNNLIKNAITNSTNPNNKSLNEHKLLNGLLSKPLNEQNSQVSQQQQQNNLLIPSSANGNVSLEQIMKLNKLNSMQQQQQQRSGNLSKHYEEIYSKSAGQVTPNQNSLLYLINNGSEQKKQLTQQSKLESSPSAAASNGLLSRMMGQHNSNISSMESNMLDLIINEIDQCVENKDSAERLRQMISQMHIYFNEKLNELQVNRNKLLSEFDEFKMNYQCENEQLRCQLKLLQIQNDLNKDHYLKTGSNQSPAQLHMSSLQQQQHQHQQHQSVKRDLSDSFKNLPPQQQNLNKSPNNSSVINQSQNSLLSAQHHFQMLLQQQQQALHQQKTQESLNAAAAVAAAQSFPQFFLNHYVPSLHHRSGGHNQPNLAIDPSNAQHNKNKSSSSSFSSPRSHSASSSPSSINNKSQNSTSINMNSSHLHQTIV